jgi:hypothetical protein
VNLGGKQDLDALLRSWPAALPKGVEAGEGEERGWEARAEAIVRAATTAQAGKDAVEALLAAPALAAEEGEDAAITAAGEKKMSNEKPGGESPASVAPPATERKRQSLKEIAARASQSGQRLSQPGTPPPSSVAPSRPAAASTPGPLSRPAEASKDDSGVINLQVVHATATAQQRADAEKAKPAQAGLFEDDKHDEAAAPKVAAVAAKPSNVTPIQPKRSNAGLIGGIAIGLIGIAAAAGIVMRKPAPVQPSAPVAAAETKAATPAPTAAATAAPAPASAEPAPVASAAPAPSGSAEADAKVAEAPKVGGPLPSGAANIGSASAAASGDAKVAAKAATPSGKPGDLQSEMAKAVGKDGEAKQDQPAGPAPEPASGGPKNQNVPEQPSQGAVAAALGPVMGGAKACVSGADDVSRANVTFSSNGSVTSVSVSGWAAAHGKSGCIQAALKAAKVGPFSKPSFSVGVPIRP